jgi:tRNA U34 2-thiouridine synthase MnmA/TrmU
MKAIVLLSGGLDSTLAAQVMIEQGIELDAINFMTIFCTCTNRGATCLASQKAVETLGISLKVFNVSEEYLGVVKHPEHGYGRNMNPCIDCRIFILKKAKVYMEESGAAFIVTGEVLGQRPMSQRKDAIRKQGLKVLSCGPSPRKPFPSPFLRKKDGSTGKSC